MSADTKKLEQIKEECFSKAKSTTPVEVRTGKLYRWKGTITSYVKGELEFRFLPNFGPVLFDSTGHISCVIVDPVKNLTKLIQLCNRKVFVRNPEFVVEIFVSDSREKSLVHLLLNVTKADLDEVLIPTEPENLSITNVEISTVLEDADRPPLETSWCQKIIPLKISSTIQAPNSDILCFVLVILVDEENTNDEELVWLILKNEDVVWKDLLIPYRMFGINISSDIRADYFSQRRSLFSFFDSWDKSFLHMVHRHKDLMKTNLLVNFPKHARVNILMEKCRINKPVEKWLHISDPVLRSTNFASVYGIIKEIRYMEAWKGQSCSWCKKFENVFEEFTQDRDRDENASEEDESEQFKIKWCTPESDIENTTDSRVLYFPEIRFNKKENEQIKGFGIRGGDTVRITLKKNYSDRVAYVFLKRWQSQYPAGLAVGVTVCFTDVNVQCTKNKYFYFVSTPLTRIIHLEETGIEMDIVVRNWGHFSFPFLRVPSSTFWGVLDLDLLTKVSISAKCKLCEKPFLQYRCTDLFCQNNQLQMDPEYTVKAIARLFVRGFEGSVSNSLYLKNENVQKYLCIPDRIWQKLQNLSANSELFYLCSNTDINDADCDITNIYFQKYCKYFRPRPRFHVRCKPFKDDENSFFCLDLAQIDDSRINSIRSAIEKKSK